MNRFLKLVAIGQQVIQEAEVSKSTRPSESKFKMQHYYKDKQGVIMATTPNRRVGAALGGGFGALYGAGLGSAIPKHPLAGAIGGAMVGAAGAGYGGYKLGQHGEKKFVKAAAPRLKGKKEISAKQFYKLASAGAPATYLRV